MHPAMGYVKRGLSPIQHTPLMCTITCKFNIILCFEQIPTSLFKNK